MLHRILFNFQLALEGVFANKLRAFLTALGIIFGVAAVIAMLAIGTGARQSIMDQMKLIGSNNIVIKSVVLDEDDQQQGSGGAQNQNSGSSAPWSKGLTLKDVTALQEVIPGIDEVSPEIELKTTIIQSGKLEKGRVIGTMNSFFSLNSLELESGNFFHERHMDGGRPVCIIGKGIQTKFFNLQDPVGQKIKCGSNWLTIIGVLEKRIASKESLENLGIRDYNSDIYVPISTALLRFKNRAHFGKKDLKRGDDDEADSDEANYHQLDRLVMQVADSKQLQASADLSARVLKRRHGNVIDYEIEIPELLLQQQQKTQDTFNWVLAVIAGISLLVGGIGIMNIMLASVLERIKEIGIRRSLGATRIDIIYQFLFEAIFISLVGGLIGVILGVSAAHLISAKAEIPTIVSTWSIVLSFGVAASVGLIFGLFPAQKAAIQDPIKALRSD